MRARATASRAALDAVSISTLTAIARTLTLAQIERIVIEDRIALLSYKGAAKSLGISQTTIYNKQMKWAAADKEARSVG